MSINITCDLQHIVPYPTVESQVECQKSPIFAVKKNLMMQSREFSGSGASKSTLLWRSWDFPMAFRLRVVFIGFTVVGFWVLGLGWLKEISKQGDYCMIVVWYIFIYIYIYMLQLLLKIAYKFSNDVIPKSKNNSRQQRNFIAGRKH